MNINRNTWKVFVPESCYSESRSFNTLVSHVSGAEARRYYVDILGEQNVSYENNEQETCSSEHKPKIDKKCKDVCNISIKDLFLCAQNDAHQLEKILVEKREWLNCCDDYGWTPLMVASQAGSVDAVKYLIKFGAKIHLEDKAGNTAFSLAKKNNNHVIMKILAMSLKNGDNPPKLNCKVKNNSNEKYYCYLCKDSYNDKKYHITSMIHNFNTSKSCKRKTCYAIPECNKGYQLMLKTGWDINNGLGPEGNGQKFPVKTSLKLDRKGIGIATNKLKITHPDKQLLDTVKERRNTGYGKFYIERNRRIEKIKERMFRREFYS